MSETKKTIRARYRELEGLKVLDINSTGYVVWLETELAEAKAEIERLNGQFMLSINESEQLYQGMTHCDEKIMKQDELIEKLREALQIECTCCIGQKYGHIRPEYKQQHCERVDCKTKAALEACEKRGKR